MLFEATIKFLSTKNPYRLVVSFLFTFHMQCIPSALKMIFKKKVIVKRKYLGRQRQNNETDKWYA